MLRAPWTFAHPMMRFFDLSLQKNFILGDSKRRIQFRMDMLNVRIALFYGGIMCLTLEVCRMKPRWYSRL